MRMLRSVSVVKIITKNEVVYEKDFKKNDLKDKKYTDFYLDKTYECGSYTVRLSSDSTSDLEVYIAYKEKFDYYPNGILEVNKKEETGNFDKLKVLNTEWKDKIEKINDSNLTKDIKNKALLNLGCNYSLPISNDSLVKQSERVKNAISSMYANIRIYTVNDTEESIEDNRHIEPSDGHSWQR